MTTTYSTANRWAANVIQGRNAKGRARPDDTYWYRGNILFNGFTACARLEQDVTARWWLIKLPSFYHYVWENGPPDRYVPGGINEGLLPSIIVDDIGVTHCDEDALVMKGEYLSNHILMQLEYRARDVLRLGKDYGIRALLEEDGEDTNRAFQLREWAAQSAIAYERYREAFAPGWPVLFDVEHDLDALIDKRRQKFLDPKLRASRLRAKARRIAIQALGLRQAS